MRSLQGATWACRAALRALEGAQGTSFASQMPSASLASRGALSTLHRRWVSSDVTEAWDALRTTFTSILADVEESTGIATLTINRPEALNALNSKVSPRKRY